MNNYNIESKLKKALIATTLVATSFLGNELYAQDKEYKKITATYTANIPASIDSSNCSLFLKDYIILNTSDNNTLDEKEQIIELNTPENSATIKFKPGFYTKKIEYQLNDSSKSIELRDEIIALVYVQRGIQAFYFTRNNHNACTIKYFEQLKIKDGNIVPHQSVLEQHPNPLTYSKKKKNSKLKDLLLALF